jgi:hypothetical protein
MTVWHSFFSKTKVEKLGLRNAVPLAIEILASAQKECVALFPSGPHLSTGLSSEASLGGFVSIEQSKGTLLFLMWAESPQVLSLVPYPPTSLPMPPLVQSPAKHPHCCCGFNQQCAGNRYVFQASAFKAREKSWLKISFHQMFFSSCFIIAACTIYV